MNSGLDRSLTGRHHHRDLQVGHDGHVARRLHKTDFQVGITCIQRCEGGGCYIGGLEMGIGGVTCIRRCGGWGRWLDRVFGIVYWRCNRDVGVVIEGVIC